VLAAATDTDDPLIFWGSWPQNVQQESEKPIAHFSHWLYDDIARFEQFRSFFLPQ
jgi:hypothetical protein